MLGKRSGLILCLCLASCSGSGDSRQAGKTADTGRTGPPSVGTMGAGDLFLAHVHNYTAYNGKVVTVFGKIDTVFRGESSRDTPCISLLAQEEPPRQIKCYFDWKEEPSLASLRPGFNVTIEGRCEGRPANSEYVIMRDCTLKRRDQ